MVRYDSDLKPEIPPVWGFLRVFSCEKRRSVYLMERNLKGAYDVIIIGAGPSGIAREALHLHVYLLAVLPFRIDAEYDGVAVYA